MYLQEAQAVSDTGSDKHHNHHHHQQQEGTPGITRQSWACSSEKSHNMLAVRHHLKRAPNLSTSSFFVIRALSVPMSTSNTPSTAEATTTLSEQVRFNRLIDRLDLLFTPKQKIKLLNIVHRYTSNNKYDVFGPRLRYAVVSCSSLVEVLPMCCPSKAAELLLC
jgi:hypothetical protein